MWLIIAVSIVAQEPALDVVALTGFLAVVVLLTCHANARHAPAFILGSALAGAVAAVYGVLQGAWPLSIAEAVWAANAVRRWWTVIHSATHRPVPEKSGAPSSEMEPPIADRWQSESRLDRLFGTK